MAALMMVPGLRWFGPRALPEIIALCLSAASQFWGDIAARQLPE
jgi:hypothetical protein